MTLLNFSNDKVDGLSRSNTAAIHARIVGQRSAPSGGDIAELLSSIAPPGQKRDEKDAAVRQLFEDGGFRSTNFQNHHIVSTLDNYPQY